MALATTCPQCKTSFRVVPDQLKLRRGFVRCGRCRHVFAGIDHLRYVDDTARAGATAAGPIGGSPAQDAFAPPASLQVPQAFEAPSTPQGPGEHDAHDEGIAFETGSDEDDTLEAALGVDAAFEAARDEDDAPDAERDDDRALHAEREEDASPGDDVEWVVVGAPARDPLSPDTRAEPGPPAFDDAGQMDDGVHPGEPPSYVERFAVDVEDGAQQRTEPVAPPAHGDERHDAVAEDDGESAIDYFTTRRSRGFADRRGLATALVALALAIVLALQWIVAQRSAIAARVPAVAPLLGAALAPFGLRIEAPSELDALTIESFELQASADADVLEMRALLRNRADHPVRWPSMQLVLTDPSDRVLVSRTLGPDDYLVEPDAPRAEGVPSQTEWPLRLALEARELQLAGYDYRVRLFYP